MSWLRHGNGGVESSVWIDERLLSEMEADASEHSPRETGGMLLGYWSAQGQAVITKTIPGGPGAVRMRTRFEPDGLWQQEILDEIYLRSGRITTYLGDWHSHPVGVLRPSGRDKSTAKEVAKSQSARAPRPLTLIGVEVGGGWKWGVFRYRGRRGFERLALERFGGAEAAERVKPTAVRTHPWAI
ncbi:MAG TPA: Mov34/MPN/PAD-1 family protein [Gaiellaceae bacterium]|jgi:integrative and conjugative element protein (TIGR02256 family)|nr:Mov34/MPN/PAD-1 family protein [Gaiellaceae bacterium]